MTCETRRGLTFYRKCLALSLSMDMTETLDGMMYTPKFKRQMLEWLMKSGERDEQAIFTMAGKMLGFV